MRCPKCNVVIADTSYFCYNCGCNFDELKQNQSENSLIEHVSSVNDLSIEKTDSEKLQELNKSLETQDEFIKYNPKDYCHNKDNKGMGFYTAICIGVVSLFAIPICNDGIISFGLFLLAIYACFSIKHYDDKNANFVQELKRKQNRIDAHNKQVLKKRFANIYIDNGFENISKEISLCKNWYYKEAIVVNDDKKIFGYIAIKFNIYSGYCIKEDIRFCDYSEIIRYEVIDKTTSTQIASSKTSSNVGKSIGGAIVSELITGETVSGAVIGASSGRKTETTYKTTKIENYDVNIYLNKLQDSIITVNTNKREKLSEIIAILEYILQNNTKGNEV